MQLQRLRFFSALILAMGATPSFRHSGWKSHKKCILLQIAKIAVLLSYLDKVSIFVSAWLDGAQIKNISENYRESEFFFLTNQTDYVVYF